MTDRTFFDGRLIEEWLDRSRVYRWLDDTGVWRSRTFAPNEPPPSLEGPIERRAIQRGSGGR